MMLRKLLMPLCLAFFVSVVSEATFAQVVDYVGNGSDPTLYGDANNWQLRGGGTQLPTGDDLVVVGADQGTSTTSNVINITQNASVDSLRTGTNGSSSAADSQTFNHSAGTLTIGRDSGAGGEDVGLWLGEFGPGQTIYNLTGTGAIVSTEAEGEAIQIGRGERATLNMSAGTSITSAGTLTVGKFGPNGVGVLNINGGTIQTTLSNTTAFSSDDFFVGQNGGKGTVNMTAGNVFVGDVGTGDFGETINLGILHVGLDSEATWNQSGGMVSAVGVEVGRFQSPTADVSLSGNAVWKVEDNIALSGGSDPFINAISSSLTITGSDVDVTAGGILFNPKSSFSVVADMGGISTITLDGTGDLHTIGGPVNGNHADLTVDLSAWTDDGSTLTLIDGVKAWTGTFDGLAEGAVVPGTNGRTISYVAGDGFDIALVGAGLPGDFNNDGEVDVDDIDAYAAVLGQSSTGNEEFNFDGDSDIDLDDLKFHVENYVMTSNGETGTFLGDLNLDGEVNVFGDGLTFIAALGNPATSYAQGDLNLSGNVDVFGDGLTFIANLGNSNAPPSSPSASAVPEPSSMSILMLFTLAGTMRRRS